MAPHVEPHTATCTTYAITTRTSTSVCSHPSTLRRRSTLLGPHRGSLSTAVLCVALLTLIGCGPEKLVGTDLGAQPSPDFTLTDARTGATVSLSGLRGNVVALTFLYTRCPDTCPLTAEHFRNAQEQLGGDAEKVRFVAVSVDPIGDTPAAVRDFSAAHRLDRNWHYLIGPEASLRAVWGAYGIRQEPSGGLVGHTDAVYVIDAKGNARVLLRTMDGVEPLTKDLRILVRER